MTGNRNGTATQVLGRPEIPVAEPFPAAVIGLGEYGRQVLVALQQAAATRPALPSTPALWASPEGWECEGQIATEAELSEEAWSAPEEWWTQYGPGAQPELKELILRALYAAGDGQATDELAADRSLDVFLVAHLHEPLARELWTEVLAAARAAYNPFADLVFTLILAVDSLAYRDFVADEATSLLASLDKLAAELEEAFDEGEPAGRIAWCYLVDTLDIHAYPLRPLATQVDGDDGKNVIRTAPPPAQRMVYQAHMTAEFMALCRGGLRHSPAYQATSLSQLRRELRHHTAAPWISTFGAGSFVLPLPVIADKARDTLARRLLSDFVLGKARPGDLPHARRLRARWLAHQTLEPKQLRRQIQRDSAGNPLVFPVEPPELEKVQVEWDEQLVLYLRDWEHILQQRWHRPDGPPEQMARQATDLTEEAATWLDKEMQTLLQKELGGVHVAHLFTSELEAAIEGERQKLDHEGEEERNWLAALLAPLRPPRRDPTVLPQLERYEQTMKSALAGRLYPLAVVTRATLFAVALLCFAWAGYRAAGRAFGFSGLVGQELGLALAGAPHLALLLDLLVLAATCWLAAQLAGAVQLLISERRISRAVAGYIKAVRRKYEALMERALRRERENVYGRLLAEVIGWREKTLARRATLETTLQTLEAALTQQSELAPLQTELNLLPEAAEAMLFPQIDDDTVQEMADVFLHSPEGLEAVDEEALLRRLRAFVEDRLEGWRAGLTLPAVLQSSIFADHPSVASTADLMHLLRERIYPAWPLESALRAAVVAPVFRELPGASLLTARFAGSPAGDEKLSPAGAWDGAFYTGETGRVAYTPTIHGLSLFDLGAWNELRALAEHSDAPQPGNSDVEIGRLPAEDGGEVVADAGDEESVTPGAPEEEPIYEGVS